MGYMDKDYKHWPSNWYPLRFGYQDGNQYSLPLNTQLMMYNNQYSKLIQNHHHVYFYMSWIGCCNMNSNIFPAKKSYVWGLNLLTSHDPWKLQGASMWLHIRSVARLFARTKFGQSWRIEPFKYPWLVSTPFGLFGIHTIENRDTYLPNFTNQYSGMV